MGSQIQGNTYVSNIQMVNKITTDTTIYVTTTGNDTTGDGSVGNTNGIVLNKGAKAQIDANAILGATTDITYDGVNATLASMRSASPKLLTNAYGTIIYE